MACVACHDAKRKCDRNSPCGRCVKLQITCVPHVSRQGKRKRTTKMNESPEELTIARSVELPTDHFGLRYLIRSWMSMAVVRRSFGLMARASNLATKLGVTMDDIMCASPTQTGMGWMGPALSVPFNQQVMGGPRLQWTELPEDLLHATSTLNVLQRETRWIWVRELNQGRSRYLVSQAFERDIVTWNMMQQTWNENKNSVVDLFLDAAGRDKHAKSVAHQYSLHPRPPTHRSARCSRQRSRVNMRNGQKVPVDEVACAAFVNIDVCYHFVEYVPIAGVQETAAPAPVSMPSLDRMPPVMQSSLQASGPPVPIATRSMWDDFPLMVNLDESGQGDELEQILNLLNG